MMISEFIERTGFEPMPEEYKEIEAEYMAAPENITKDKFCKDWKRNGGIQRYMRRRARKIEELNAYVDELSSDYEKEHIAFAEYQQNATERVEEYESTVADLESKLAHAEQEYAELERKLKAFKTALNTIKAIAEE